MSRSRSHTLVLMATLALSALLAGMGGASCSSTSSHADISFREIAEQKYGPDVEYLPNSSNSCVLCVHRPKGPPPLLPVAFFLYDRASGVIILEDSLANGEAVWLNDTTVEVRTIPEAASGEGEGHAYRFDISTRRRTTVR